MTYNINRKYSLRQYENLDLYVEGLESREEIKKELEHFDKIAEEYRAEQKAKDEIGEPSRKIRMAGTKEWLTLKDNLLYKMEKPEPRPVADQANQEVAEAVADKKEPF